MSCFRSPRLNSNADLYALLRSHSSSTDGIWKAAVSPYRPGQPKEALPARSSGFSIGANHAGAHRWQIPSAIIRLAMQRPVDEQSLCGSSSGIGPTSTSKILMGEALALAARQGNVALVQMLIALGANRLSYDRFFHHPAAHAASQGHHHFAEYLL
ncbi:hypothetical protein BDW75DRAFT_242956 [Aspergillus navahoensis]